MYSEKNLEAKTSEVKQFIKSTKKALENVWQLFLLYLCFNLFQSKIDFKPATWADMKRLSKTAEKYLKDAQDAHEEDEDTLFESFYS